MPEKIKVVVTRQLIPEAQKLLESEPNLEIIQWHNENPCDRNWLLTNAPNSTGILLTLSDKVDTELLETAGPTLKVISSFSVGTDHIETSAVKHRNIRLGYTPTILTDAVADLAVMLILMAQRRGGEGIRNVLDGRWPQMPWSPALMTGPQIGGSVVGFLGFGRIAQATVKRLVPFGVEKVVYLTSRPGERAREDYFGLLRDQPVSIEPAGSWEEVARESDIVVVACSLSESTKHLVGTEFLGMMKKEAVVVNIARGPVVDTDALMKALDEERIFGAGLDVIEGEPNITADHPILRQKRCVLVPHIGSATFNTRMGMAMESVRNLLAVLRGEEMVNECVL
ncbi:hypothetical protein M011DRAFT_397177 [Sporormia fimetaria CBS 119925]|uniref:Glyoxylate reductase n=1 Tax=Sporormia fimetaria CBS 119925 TaxID=1340428 RepID=A0A6A6VHN0_9PLEO|nr:hypothetical protein M011DRAFT_397177 [Sporormia fimetaria CBS 119925]